MQTLDLKTNRGKAAPFGKARRAVDGDLAGKAIRPLIDTVKIMPTPAGVIPDARSVDA
jgi:hypothetical protein